MKTKIERKIHVIDATDQILGRLATKVATLLMGKHKPTYLPNVDAGDKVVVKNAAKIRVTGNKPSQKIYRHHSNHPGGLKEIVYSELKRKKPTEIFYLAVSRMLPRNRLRTPRLKRLTIEA